MDTVQRSVANIDGIGEGVSCVGAGSPDMMAQAVGKQHGDLFRFSPMEHTTNSNLPPGEWCDVIAEFRDFAKKVTRPSGMMKLKEIFKQFCKFAPGTQTAHTICPEPNFMSLSGDEWLRLYTRHNAMALRSLLLSKPPVEFLEVLKEYDLLGPNFQDAQYPYTNLTHVLPLPPLLQPRVVYETETQTPHINDAVYFREAQILEKEYDAESPALEGNMMSSSYFGSIFQCQMMEGTLEVSPFISQSEHFAAYSPLVYDTKSLFALDDVQSIGLTDLLVETFLQCVALKFKDVYDEEALQKLRTYIISASSPYAIPVTSMQHTSDVFRTVFYKVPKLIIGALSPQYTFNLNSPFLSIFMSALTLYSIKNAVRDISTQIENIRALIGALTTFALTCEAQPEQACATLRVQLQKIQSLVDADLEVILKTFAPIYADTHFMVNNGRSVQSLYGVNTETVWYAFVELCRRIDHIRWFDAASIPLNIPMDQMPILRAFASSLLEAAYLHLNAMAACDGDLPTFCADLVGGDYTQFYDHKKSIERQLDFERLRSTHSLLPAVNIAVSIAFSIVSHQMNAQSTALSMNSHIRRPADMLRIFSIYGSMLYTESATSITSSFGTTALIIDRNKFNRIRFSIYLMHFKMWILDGLYWWANYRHITSEYELTQGVLARYDDLRDRFFPQSPLDVPGHLTQFVTYPISGPMYLMTVAACIQLYVAKSPTLLRTFAMSLVAVSLRDYFPFCCISQPTDTMIYNTKFRDATLDKYVIFSPEFERVLASLPVALTEQAISRLLVDVYNEVLCPYITSQEYVQKYVTSEFGPGFTAEPIDSIYLAPLPKSQSFLVPAMRWFMEVTSDHTKLELLVKLVYYAQFIGAKLRRRESLNNALTKIHRMNIHQDATTATYGHLMDTSQPTIFSIFYQTHPSLARPRNEMRIHSQVEWTLSRRCKTSLEDMVSASTCFPVSALFDDAAVLMFYNNNVVSDTHNVFRWVDDPHVVMLYRDVITINMYHTFYTLLASQQNPQDQIQLATQYLSGIKQTLPINSVCMGPEWRSAVAEAMNVYPDIAAYWCRYLSMAFDTDLMITAAVKALRYDWDYAQYVAYVFDADATYKPVISVRKKLVELSERYNLTTYAPISIASPVEHKMKPIAHLATPKEVVDQTTQQQHTTQRNDEGPNPFSSFDKLPQWARQSISRVNQRYAPETELGNELKYELMQEMAFLSTHGCRFWNELYIDNGLLSSKSLI